MQQLKAGIRRYVWLLFALWCVLAVGIWQVSKQTIQMISTVNELGSKVEEVRNFFNFELQYRVQHVDQISLKLQLVYAVRIQLELKSSEGMIPTDLTPLLYSTDRFLENAHAFIASDSELNVLAEQLRKSRTLESNSEQIDNMYYRLGALVLESIFSDSATNADTYRELDSLFIESDALAMDERTAFQRGLAQTSSVLAANAQGRYLAAQLLKPDLANQLATTYTLLEKLLLKLLALLGVGSGFFLAMVTWAAYDKRSAKKPVVPTLPETQLEPISTNASYQKNEVRELATESLQKNVPVEFDEPYIDLPKMLDYLSGDEGAVRMLLEVFIQDHSDDGTKLRQLLNEDQEHAQLIAHSLKGVSGSLGAMPLHYISSDIELLIKEKQKISESKLAQLHHVLEQTTLFAESVLNSEKI
ncbi:Hpt domain-containing protein [Vibrio sp. YIC-376]|uniref:Hpt domain-containing protein n=1 Tax=Vibrio sp. YIC-376 TaxID=3136162 RepID=UPI00402ADE1C